MVAGLLPVAEPRPQKCQKRHRDKYLQRRDLILHPQYRQHRIAAQYRNKGGAQMSQKSCENGQAHISGQRFHQSDQFRHDPEAAALFHR